MMTSTSPRPPKPTQKQNSKTQGPWTAAQGRPTKKTCQRNHLLPNAPLHGSCTTRVGQVWVLDRTMVVWLRTPGLRWTNSPGKRRKVVRNLLTQDQKDETLALPKTTRSPSYPTRSPSYP